MPHTHLIEQRLRFLEFDQQTLAALERFKKILEPDMDRLLQRFYHHVMQQPEIQALFPNPMVLAKAQTAQKSHWLDILFSGDLAEKHFESAERIGEAHEHIGLPLGWYLGGYCIMMNQFLRLAADHYANEPIALTQMVQALNKVVFLDFSFVIDSYIDAKDKAIKKVLIEAEQFSGRLRNMNGLVAEQTNDLKHNLADVLSELQTLHEHAETHSNLLQTTQQQLITADTSPGSNLKDLQQSAKQIVRQLEDTQHKLEQAVTAAFQIADQLNNANRNNTQVQDQHRMHFDRREPNKKKNFLKIITSRLRF